MDAQERKKVAVIARYVNESFSAGDWVSLGQVTGGLKVIREHPRLLRSLNFGDEDYSMCVSDVLESIFLKAPDKIDEVIDLFDIDLWYEQKEPAKYAKVFLGTMSPAPKFWADGYLHLFISHLSANKRTVSALKAAMARWGISAFVAHEDIEPSKEWQREIELALETMDVMVAVVEPGFRESNWCCQEVGFAMGRRVDVIPLRVGLDPFGLFGKYQGIQAKSKYPKDIAQQIVRLLLSRPKHRRILVASIPRAIASMVPAEKTERLRELDSFGILADADVKSILEMVSLTKDERDTLQDVILRSKAFDAAVPPAEDDANVPF